MSTSSARTALPSTYETWADTINSISDLPYKPLHKTEKENTVKHTKEIQMVVSNIDLEK